MSVVGLQYLYRYRHLQGNHCKYTRRIMTDSVLYFASPTQFNDPFDCKIHFQPSVSLPNLRQYYTNLLNKRLPQLNRSQRRAQGKQDLINLNRSKLIEGIKGDLQNEVDRTGILSLSATNRNILLWSHYAAGHSGLCLQFLATDSTPFFGEAQPVHYSTEYPNIFLLDHPEKQVESFLLTKAPCWRYEEEWRIIDYDRGSGEQVFPEELLVGVILGARMSSDDRDYIINLLKQRKSMVKIYKASISKDCFSLDIKDYEP